MNEHNQILTWEQISAEAQKAIDAKQKAIDANMPKGRYVYMAGEHCSLMPSEAHCWHEVSVFWDGLFPPPLVCCWCGSETFDMNTVPHRHGPYAAHEKR